uniref:Uncharacterized protein n=1 Tax=Anguilla anguilla TaxID=7936 RepID=A0A0E9SX31_ANGAN
MFSSCTGTIQVNIAPTFHVVFHVVLYMLVQDLPLVHSLVF